MLTMPVTVLGLPSRLGAIINYALTRVKLLGYGSGLDIGAMDSV
jgi:hypothetical protein